MRIAFVTPEYVTESNYDGGLANYIHRVSLGLLEYGHQPFVVVASDRDETLKHHGIEVHRVVDAFASNWVRTIDNLTGGRARVSLRTLVNSWSLNARIRSIHSRTPLSLVQYPNYTAPGLFRLTSVPSVTRLSSYMPLWKANGTPTNAQTLFWERLSLHRADALFGPSRVIAKAVESAIGRQVEIIETPFVLDRMKLDDSEYQRQLSGKSYVLFFGTINRVKGALTLAGAVEQILREHPDLYFVLVGAEAGQVNGMSMMTYIRHQAGPHRDRVIHLPKMRHERLYPIVEQAECVVLPSRIDNFPNTCLEAMAHRRVVIGTRGASFEQLMTDGKSGFLCGKDDSTSLAATVRKVLNLSPSEREAIGTRAAERVETLAPKKVVRELLTFYKDVIDSRGVRSESPPRKPEFSSSGSQETN